ncbi:hypothetical protein L249_4125, partial [Ophiocordyceps polyrhachis-furcata BCC 54312]
MTPAPPRVSTNQVGFRRRRNIATVTRCVWVSSVAEAVPFFPTPPELAPQEVASIHPDAHVGSQALRLACSLEVCPVSRYCPVEDRQDKDSMNNKPIHGQPEKGACPSRAKSPLSSAKIGIRRYRPVSAGISVIRACPPRNVRYLLLQSAHSHSPSGYSPATAPRCKVPLGSSISNFPPLLTAAVARFLHALFSPSCFHPHLTLVLDACLSP